MSQNNIRSRATPAVQFSTVTGCWTLVSPFDLAIEGRPMRIDSGFQFDLASIPRFLWWFLAPFELSISAPLVHDWLYRHGGCVADTSGETVCLSRQGVDRIFRQIMHEECVQVWRVALAWCAVRLFGWTVWETRREPQARPVVHAP